MNKNRVVNGIVFDTAKANCMWGTEMISRYSQQGSSRKNKRILCGVEEHNGKIRTEMER